MHPDGDVRYNKSTNQADLAGEQALRKSCKNTAKKERKQDNFALRVEQEKKWRKQLLENSGSKAVSSISTFPAGFLSKDADGRAQRSSTYGPRVQVLFEEDVKTFPRAPEDIIVPSLEPLGNFETEYAAYCAPYKGYYKQHGTKRGKSTSEATTASVFSAVDSKAGSQVLVPMESLYRASYNESL